MAVTAIAGRGQVGSHLSTLRELATAYGDFRIGVAVTYDVLSGTYASILAAEFNHVTTGNEMKFSQTEATQNVFTYTHADTIVNAGAANGQTIHGHNLIWVDGVPAWVTGGGFNKAQLQAVMSNHIANVVGHYVGRVHSWDVVNEPFNATGALRGAAGTWYAVIGAEYIENALTYARATDPAAKLFVNEYGAEARGPKQDALYSMCVDFLSRGIPIDGVGFECHFGLDAPNSTQLQASLARFTALGLQVRISELDVMIANGADAWALAKQVDVVTAVFDAACRTSGCVGVNVWGLTDLYSDIPGLYPGYDNGCLFDDSYAKKAMYNAAFARLASQVPLGADPTLWTSGLEHEDATFSEEFNTKAVAGSCTVAVQSSVKHAGASAGLITYDGSGTHAYAFKLIYGSPADLWVRAYVRFNATYAYATDHGIAYILTVVSLGNPIIRVGVQCDTAAASGRDSLRWVAQFFTPTTYLYLGTYGEVTKDTWWGVKIRWVAGSGANGGGQFWVNEVSQGSDFTKDQHTLQPDGLRLGADFVANAPVAGSLMYFDDVAVDVTDPGA